MNWIILILAGLCEVGFTYCLGRAKSLEGLVWWLWIGLAYPVWTGIGADGTVLVGIFFFHEPVTLWRMLFTLTRITSIIGLKVLS